MKSANKVARSKYSAVTCRTTDWRLNITCWNPGLRRLLFVSLSSSSFLGLMLWSDEPKADSDSGEKWLKLHVRNKKKKNYSMSEIKNEGRVMIQVCVPIMSVLTRFHCG